MTEIEFTDARREAIRLLVGVAGGTGSGKTYSALRLARGLAGDEPFALIDTEHGRAKQYADEFAFKYAGLEPPFTPARYLEAIRKASAIANVVVVDSGSHEWNGQGGVLDMADAEFERLGSRDSARLSMWIAPKREHKRYVQELVRLPAHVILCLRAEPKIEITKENGKTVVREKRTLPGAGLDGWIPVCDSMLPFECTLSFLLMADAPGVPRPMKLPGALAPLVPLGDPLSEDVGRALAVWAAGNDAPTPLAPDGSPGASTAGAPPAESEHNLGDQVTTVWIAIPQERRPSLEQLAAKIGRRDAAPSFREFVASLSQAEAETLFAALSEYQSTLSGGGGS